MLVGFGLLLTCIYAWVTTSPIRTVRAALAKVEDGDFTQSVVVFDGTELGELQRGFNAMVCGLRERDHVRDLFGRHVGRSVAAAAETQELQLGGNERHVAASFVDIKGSTDLVASLPPADVVEMLNRFFAIVVDEVDRQMGLVNKFAGDGCLAVFGAPIGLDDPEDRALIAARTIARRLTTEVPECDAGVGVAAGTAIAGNVGAHERFEYTVIGAPVNTAARLCELAKDTPQRVITSTDTTDAASDDERQRWQPADQIMLRGFTEPVRIAVPLALGL